jgi:hypothetical protein
VWVLSWTEKGMGFEEFHGVRKAATSDDVLGDRLEVGEVAIPTWGHEFRWFLFPLSQYDRRVWPIWKP